MLEIVGVIIDVPDMRQIFFLQVGMQALAHANQAVLVAAWAESERIAKIKIVIGRFIFCR